MPGKQPRALCPVCQEPLAPDETECANCGAFVIDEAVVRLSRAFGIDREKALHLFEAGFRRPEQLRGRDVDGVLERRETGLLFICTNCGSFVATGDSRCSRCNAEFEEDEEPQTGWAGEESDILDLLLCPNCGADNTPDWAECEICGERLSGPTPSAPPRPEPEKAAEPPKPLEVPRVREPAVERYTTPPRVPAASRAVSAAPRPRAPREAPPPEPQPEPPELEPSPVRLPVASPIPREPPLRPEPRPAARAAEDRPAPVRRAAGIRVAPRPHAGPRGPRPLSRIPPADLIGPAVVAAGVSLLGSARLGHEWLVWSIAFVLTVLAGWAFASARPVRSGGLERTDGILLILGMALGTAGAFLVSSSPDLATGSAMAGVASLAACARRVLIAPERHLLVAAGAVPLVSLAAVAALAPEVAATAAWTFGALAALPWPAAVAVGGARQRRFANAVRKEIVRAESQVAHRDFEGSVETFERAIDMSERGGQPEDLPWYGKGATLIMMGQYEEALKAIDRALDINPRNEVAWVNKGNAYTKMGQLVDALRCFNAALKVNPRYEVAWNNKGNALARLGRYEEALRCYERALESDPGYRGAWVNKGYVLAKLGRYDEAAACADRVLHMKNAIPVDPP